MTTTDTRAALEAAIDAYAQAAIDSGSILGAPYDGPTLSAAWCAVALEVENHVEAEVARRLAAAPDVEVAIVDYALAAQGDFDTSEERDALRAAFAADKARAVEAATAGMRPIDPALAALPRPIAPPAPSPCAYPPPRTAPSPPRPGPAPPWGATSAAPGSRCR